MAKWKRAIAMVAVAGVTFGTIANGAASAAPASRAVPERPGDGYEIGCTIAVKGAVILAKSFSHDSTFNETLETLEAADGDYLTDACKYWLEERFDHPENLSVISVKAPNGTITLESLTGASSGTSVCDLTESVDLRERMQCPYQSSRPPQPVLRTVVGQVPACDVSECPVGAQRRRTLGIPHGIGACLTRSEGECSVTVDGVSVPLTPRRNGWYGSGGVVPPAGTRLAYSCGPVPAPTTVDVYYRQWRDSAGMRRRLWLRFVVAATAGCPGTRVEEGLADEMTSTAPLRSPF